MQLTYEDSTLSVTMGLEIGNLVIAFVAFLDKQLVNRMQLLTCFSSLSLGKVVAKFDSYWLYYFRNSLAVELEY